MSTLGGSVHRKNIRSNIGRISAVYWRVSEYIGGISAVCRRDISSTSEGYQQYIRGISGVHQGDIRSTLERYQEYNGEISGVQWRDIGSTSEDTILKVL